MSQSVYDDHTKYRKRAKKKSPAKTDHKHDFQPCLFQTCRKHFNRTRGYVQTGEPTFEFGSYCPICGKTSHADIDRWFQWVPTHPDSRCGCYEYTDCPKAEFDPETRTLSAFMTNDIFPPKYVDLGNQVKED